MQTPNGILPVDKPAGWTSFDVLAKLRGALGTRKLGHSGTLDPMATGVLAVFIGKATSAADRQLDHDKTYEATLRLGLRTDTGDVTGTTLETAPVTVGEAELRAVLPQFRGDRMQLPPMYSAVKINGQPLYKAARKGQTVERTPRPITIYDIEYLGSPAPDEYTVRVACSKGTYIRVLAEEIGDALGVPATLKLLTWAVTNGNLPLITSSGIKSLLIRGATRMPGTSYPSRQWGYGTLDVYNAFEVLRLGGNNL